ncbi:putative glycolipid-binding domain-containing protein [Pseudonocardia cypriaca]|uniref:Glycolipid-binding protein n=1 Tax=Pseudonocardia cypriaca TaxID=882449 RepID=A0A543FR53_9PSEU|nr:putative glycolipid-binding domain-containing protein [Pseudonocardia cypriaca]TQM36319.1 hypothetical protein FB388_7776 [Pseudonocardia cypriaca]
MLTWQAEDGHGLEGVRMIPGHGGFRALGRMVRVEPTGGFTSSYRLVVGEDGRVSRLSVTSATAERERHLTINRTDDGVWLLDTGSGSGAVRDDCAGAVDVDLAYSPMFNTIPIRRLGLHREAGEHTLPMVFVSLPDLEVRVVEQTYRTVSVFDEDAGHAGIGFRSGDFTADLVVDADGVVASYPGLARRLLPATS